jgi:biopolymer transport protein ExbD
MSDSAEHKPITKPGPWLCRSTGLSSGRYRGRGGKKRPISASLQLTPMIDMFIVVLIFLLMAFSTGKVLVSPHLKLPAAQQVEELTVAPVVSVTRAGAGPQGGVITLEGSEVATLVDLNDQRDDWLIHKLKEQLEVFKHNWKVTNPTKQFPGRIIVQADQQLDFRVLKKVIYSCGVAGYPHVHFAVHPKT